MSKQDQIFEDNIIAEQKKTLIKEVSKRYGVILLDKKNVQVLCGFSAATLNRLIASSSIPYVKLGESEAGQVKFIVTDIIEMIFKNRVKAFNFDIKEGNI